MKRPVGVTFIFSVEEEMSEELALAYLLSAADHDPPYDPAKVIEINDPRFQILKIFTFMAGLPDAR